MKKERLIPRLLISVIGILFYSMIWISTLNLGDKIYFCFNAFIVLLMLYIPLSILERMEASE